jgi:hypothetical protein
MSGALDHHIHLQRNPSAGFWFHPPSSLPPQYTQQTVKLWLIAINCREENHTWNSMLQAKGQCFPKAVFLWEPYLGLLQCLSWYLTPPPQVREHSDHFDQADHWPCIGRGPSSPNFTHWPCRHHCEKNMRHGTHQRSPEKTQGEQTPAQ